VGVDVGKEWLDLFVESAKDVERFANDEDGLVTLVGRVSIVKPRQVRQFAEVIGQTAKTDALDAKLLALFAAKVEPPPTTLPDLDTQRQGGPAAQLHRGRPRHLTDDAGGPARARAPVAQADRGPRAIRPRQWAASRATAHLGVVAGPCATRSTWRPSPRRGPIR
jgi:transposase